MMSTKTIHLPLNSMSGATRSQPSQWSAPNMRSPLAAAHPATQHVPTRFQASSVAESRPNHVESTPNFSLGKGRGFYSEIWHSD